MKTKYDRLGNQLAQQIEIQNNVEPERAIKQALPQPQECNCQICNLWPPDCHLYFVPGKPLLPSSAHNTNKVQHILFVSNIFSSMRHCIPSYHSQLHPSIVYIL